MPSLTSHQRAEAIVSEFTQLLFAEHHQRAQHHRGDVALFAFLNLINICLDLNP